MTDERAKKVEWLNRAFHAEKLANAYMENFERDKEFARRLTRVNSNMSLSSANENSTEKVLLQFTETSILTQKKLVEALRIRNEIANAIQKLEDADMRAILTLRHLCYMTFDETAEAMGYARITVVRKYEKALEKIIFLNTDIIEKNSKNDTQ